MLKAKPATAKGYIKALRSTHVEQGLDTSIFNDPCIELLLRGGKRVYGEGEKRLRLPLTAPILRQIVNEIKQVDFDSVNLKTAICVAFTTFLRSGEFTWNSCNSSSSQFHLSRRHVTFNHNSATVILPTSKTDPFRKGTAIQLASSPSSSICPVNALRHLFNRFPRDPSHPLFSRTFGPFNRQYVVDKVKELLLRAGITTVGFSGHSLRKGAAVSAAANGISKDDIKLLGRWKSDAVDVYINEINEHENTRKLLILNSKLHNFPPPKLVASLAPTN
jgi:hypothetical protein